MKRYYHFFANGDDARNFITSEEEFKLAFNRVGLCCHLSGVTVVAFSVEDTHLHALLWGVFDECEQFKNLFVRKSQCSIVSGRGSLDGVKLDCELYEVDDENYLRNVASYVVVQATKDGKAVMPYDYIYGTGSLYFRSEHCVLPWMVSKDGGVMEPVRFDAVSSRDKRKLCGSRENIPDHWLVCNGFILPTNFVDVKRFESIFKTHNCFRVFMSSGRDKYMAVQDMMASVRGIMIEDLEARRLCESVCLALFGRKGTRHVTPEQRIELSRELRRRYGLSIRQISTLTRLPEEELCKYLR